MNLRLAILLGGLFLAALPEIQARPPQQHSVSGIVTAIDLGNHTITLQSVKGEKTWKFVWSNSTRFFQGSDPICAGALASGQPIKVHYRREIGQFVVRDLSLQIKEPVHCAPQKCCREAA